MTHEGLLQRDAFLYQSGAYLRHLKGGGVVQIVGEYEIMLGRSVAGSAPSSSWDVLDAEVSDPEQPATSKAAVHARITRSILPAKDSPPPLVGTPPALPESQAELILRVRSLGMVGTTAPEPQYGAAYCGYQLRYFGEQSHEIDGFCRLRAGRGHELKDRPEHHQRQRYPHPSQIH